MGPPKPSQADDPPLASRVVLDAITDRLFGVDTPFVLRLDRIVKRRRYWQGDARPSSEGGDTAPQTDTVSLNGMRFEITVREVEG